MNRFDGFLRWAWSVLVVCTLAFALGACSGDDGRDGTDGADGVDGVDGVDGQDGTGASVTPLESCGVCHDDGSFASAPDYHELPPIEMVSNVAFAVNGADLDVTFALAADGTAAMDYDSMQRGYRTDGAVRTDICGAPGRSDPCDPAMLTLTNNGGGNYTVKVLGGAAAAGTDSRYLFRVGAGDDRETRVYFYGDFPASPVLEPIVSAEACTNCHGPEGIDVHGGYYAATDGAEPCLTCHGVDTTPSLAEVTHGYHNSIWVDDGEVVHITYPTYMTNCSVCHSEPLELLAANTMPFSEDCFSCHGTMDSWDFTGPPDLTLHYSLTPTPETADCSACHNPTGIAANKLFVTDSHDGWESPRHGFIYDGVDTSVVEGDKFDWAITSMIDDGVNLTFTWEASYDGIGVDPCNDTVGVGAPLFHLSGELGVRRSYSQGDDFIIGTSTSAPGQPSNVDLDDVNTVCAGNVATTTIPAEAVVAEKGRLAMGGKPLVLNPDGLEVEARVPSPTYDWVIGDGAPAVARRAIVDTEKCLACHVGSLYQHGGDRVDNNDLCLVCHNAASNEQNVRMATMGIDPADAYDGQAGETFEMKTMIHRIHSAGEEGNSPYVIYRGRGIYGFATDDSLLPNWPGTGSQVAYGSTIANDGSPGSFVVNHNFHTPNYPRGLYDCQACHVGGTDFQPDQTKAMASTRVAGSDVWDDQIDDVLQGAATTACVTCHADGAARGHAYQNSWAPQEFEEGRDTIIDAAN